MAMYVKKSTENDVKFPKRRVSKPSRQQSMILFDYMTLVKRLISLAWVRCRGVGVVIILSQKWFTCN